MILCIDPSVTCTGWALFHDNKKLAACGVLKRANTLHAAIDDLRAQIISDLVSEVVFELPQVYYGGKNKVDANDLIAITAVGAALAGAMIYADIHQYSPNTWKGTLAKDFMGKRIILRLDELELDNYEACIATIPETKRNNAVDAIGLGLYHFGRLTPVKAYNK